MLTIRLPNGIFEYDPSRPLGKPGGFGQVFEGRTAMGQLVAVKQLNVSASDAAHRELRIADELSGRAYQHVIPFIDSGEDAETGRYFVVMPKAEGNLQGAIDKTGQVDPAEAALVLSQIVYGLIEVIELVHRDLKPDNILFFDGKWRIADFGIARFFEEATASNTLKDCLSRYYAAPEQWRGERATHATDVYALGCIGFFLLTGNPPFVTDPCIEHQKQAVPAFTCTDSRLSVLLRTMLRKAPSTRPSLSQVREILDGIVRDAPKSITADAMAVLAESAAQVAEEEQKSEAHHQAKVMVHQERSALAITAFEILKENLERLWGTVHSQISNAVRRDVATAFQIGLGQGYIYVDLSRQNHFDPGLFRQSGWDVICMSHIKVSQQEPMYVWAASLWYMKLPDAVQYRWFETSYFSFRGEQFQPFGTSDFRSADLAAAKVVTNVNIAFGPDHIDDEKEGDFHRRWLWLLAKAAAGQLRHPRSLPITTWPPQFA